jgi:hypothetical protein
MTLQGVLGAHPMLFVLGHRLGRGVVDHHVLLELAHLAQRGADVADVVQLLHRMAHQRLVDLREPDGADIGGQAEQGEQAQHGGNRALHSQADRESSHPLHHGETVLG